MTSTVARGRLAFPGDYPALRLAVPEAFAAVAGPLAEVPILPVRTALRRRRRIPPGIRNPDA